MIGRTVGHYRIESKLGEGGMGVVYRARDLSLNRTVAVKFLSCEVADEGRRRRFQQEAQAASALNHPHILTVYEAGSIDDQPYLVTEFIDGVTLREWAQCDGRSWRQIVELMTGIADALACAHQAGILHRDVKPENILVPKSGYAKLVDFGLAKLFDTPCSAATKTRTIAAEMTRPGAILGTVGYMSPEQAAGKPVDARSDIFAFGVVLYELLAGERPFSGRSDVDVLHAVLYDSPRSLVELRPDIPAEVRISVEKGLEKEPGERHQSMREMVVELRRAQRVKTSEARIAVAAPRPKRLRWIVPTAAGGAALLALAIATWILDRSDFFWRNPLANAQFTRLTDFEGTECDADISADGKFVVFLSDRNGPFDAWVHQLGTGVFVNLTKGRVSELSGEDHRNIGFYGDGGQVWLRVMDRSSGFTRTNVWTVPTMGGVPRPSLENALEPAASPDHSKIVYHGFTGGDPIFVADRNGGNSKQIFVDKPGVHCHFQTWSPDGRYVYFVKGIPPAGEWDIWRIPSAGGQAERITHHNSRVFYPVPLDNRTLLYTAADSDGSGSRLYSIDVERRIPHRVSGGVEQYTSLAGDGEAGRQRRLVATVSNPSGNLWTVPLSDRVVEESAATRLQVSTVRAVAPRFGPDYVVYLSSRGGGKGLWKWSQEVATELWSGSEGPVAAAAAVSPDGRQISFPVRKDGRTTLHLISANGTNPRTLAESLDIRGSASWSPDGKWIAVAADDGSGSRIFKVPVDGGRPIRLTEDNSANPVWSPDGRFILYTGPDENGVFPLRAVTPDKKAYPLPELWLQRAGGERFCFLPKSGAIVVQQGQFMDRKYDFWVFDLATGHLRQLTKLRPGFTVREFDVSADGKRILFERVRENSDIVLIELTR